MQRKSNTNLTWVFMICLSWAIVSCPVQAFGEKPIDLTPKYQQGIVLSLKEIQSQSYEQIFSLALQEPFLNPASIKRFYLQVTGNINEQTNTIEEFIAAAHDRRYEIYLYLSKPQYANEHGEPTITWDSLLDYQLKQPIEKKFDGAFLNIQPYQLKSWPQNERQIMNKYISLLKTLKSQKILSRVNIPIMITVHPQWIYENTDTSPPYLYELMNYVNEIGVDTQSFDLEPLIPSLIDIGRYLKKLNSSWFLIAQNSFWTQRSLYKPSLYYAFQFNKVSILQDIGFLGVIFTDYSALSEFNASAHPVENVKYKINSVNQIIEGSDKDWDFNVESALGVTISSSNIVLQMSQNDKYLYIAVKSDTPLKTLKLYFSPKTLAGSQMKQAVMIADIDLTSDRPRGTWVNDLNYQRPFSIVSHIIKEKETPFIEIAIPKDSLTLDNEFYFAWGVEYSDGLYFNQSFDPLQLNYQILCTRD
jgi:hypothetical protein